MRKDGINLLEECWVFITFAKAELEMKNVNLDKKIEKYFEELNTSDSIKECVVPF